MNDKCADYAHSSSGIRANNAHDTTLSLVHNAHMDTEWIKAQKKALKVSDLDIAHAIGRERSVANRLVNGKLPFDLKYVEGFAKILQVGREEILRRVGALEGEAEVQPSPNGEVVKMEGRSTERVREDLPVFGAYMGASREIEGEEIEQTMLNQGEINEYVKRPAILNNRPGAYGFHVQGSSMHPALRDGDMVAVSPNMPLSVGDTVVVYLRAQNPEIAELVIVKELVMRSASYVELRQYQPAKDFRIDMREVIKIDRVLTRREMMT